MSIVAGMATVPSNSTVPVITVPAGLCNVTTWQSSAQAAQPVYIGLSSAMTTANGFAVTNTPGEAFNYNSSRGVTAYATTGNAVPSSFYYIISTAN
jgi:hypothetical protein